MTGVYDAVCVRGRIACVLACVRSCVCAWTYFYDAACKRGRLAFALTCMRGRLHVYVPSILHVSSFDL